MTSNEVATTNGQTGKAPVQVPLVGQLNDLDQAYRYAAALAQSSILPKDLIGKPANVLAIILYGQQLALTPMQAIQSIYVVNGRPQMSGQLWLSKVREAGHRVEVSDHTAKSCTVTITRGDTDEPHTETFTWDEAVTAGLTKKDVWKSYPKRMLLWRAVSNCATVICPEVALGFGAEEPEIAEPERPTLAQVAAERIDREQAHAKRIAEAASVDAETASEAARQGKVSEQVAQSAAVDAEHAASMVTEPDADMLADLAEIEREHTAPSPDSPIAGLFDPEAGEQS